MLVKSKHFTFCRWMFQFWPQNHGTNECTPQNRLWSTTNSGASAGLVASAGRVAKGEQLLYLLLRLVEVKERARERVVERERERERERDRIVDGL